MKTKTESIDLNKLKQIEEINRKSQLVVENRKNVNNLVDLLDLVREDINRDISSEDKCPQIVVETVIKALNKIFIRFIHNKELVISCDESEANQKYKNWLIDVYNQTNDTLCQIIGNKQYSKSTQRLSLNCLMKSVTEEGKYPFRTISEERKDTFAEDLLNDIIRQLLSSTSDNKDLIHNYAQNYLNFDDVIHYTLNAIKSVLSQTSDAEDIPQQSINDESIEAKEVFLRNTYKLLSTIRLKLPKELVPKADNKSDKKRKNKETKVVANIILCVKTQPNQKKFKINYERDADLFANVWTQFLSQRLPKDLYKNVLLLLDKQLIQHFRNPLVLTDFLVNSYSIGGVVSLLSLSSLYVLIQKCNLNYPKFYHKLYALLEPGILNVQYRPRFLFWTDIFLSSTHISAQIVASFIKRLSRIALTASPDSILILLPIIGNLLIRHPTLISMARTVSFQTQNITTDPFDDNTDDPDNTCALNSYLWEIKSLQKHFCPEVAKTALFINNELSNRETDLSELLETTFDDILQNSIKKLSQEKQLTFSGKHSEQLFGYLK